MAESLWVETWGSHLAYKIVCDQSIPKFMGFLVLSDSMRCHRNGGPYKYVKIYRSPGVGSVVVLTGRRMHLKILNVDVQILLSINISPRQDLMCWIILVSCIETILHSCFQYTQKEWCSFYNLCIWKQDLNRWTCYLPLQVVLFAGTLMPCNCTWYVQ